MGTERSKLPVSVVVITKDEAENIAACLESVSWADELIVVDDESSDNTKEIAGRYTDKVYTRKMDIEGRHRNWAYSKASNEWILSLDADERATQELRDSIKAILEEEPRFEAFAIPIRTYIGQRWVRYGGWYPANKLRFFKKHAFRYEDTTVHPRVLLSGEWTRLYGDIIHLGYPDIGHFFESLNNQTRLEAEKWLTDKRKVSLIGSLRKSMDRFIRTYIFKRGYKEGFLGFMVALFAGLYQLLSYAKYWEKTK